MEQSAAIELALADTANTYGGGVEYFTDGVLRERNGERFAVFDGTAYKLLRQRLHDTDRKTTRT